MGNELSPLAIESDLLSLDLPVDVRLSVSTLLLLHFYCCCCSSLVSEMAEVYSLGMVMLELLTAKPPVVLVSLLPAAAAAGL